MQLIHFNCFALTGYEHPAEDEEIDPEHFGLYLTDADAAAAQRRIEQEREREWSENLCAYPLARSEPPQWHYDIIPLSEVTSKSFWELDDQIKEAAKLRAKGVGVTIY